MIYLSGGPSHIDMYDLQASEAPAEFRGEYRPIRTNVPGVQICEHFPMQARMWDKLSCVRSIVATDEHSDSYVMTGYSENANRQMQHPSFGAVVSKLRNGQNDIPPFVSLRGMSIGTEPGYLGIAHRPFTPEGAGLENLKMHGTCRSADRAKDAAGPVRFDPPRGGHRQHDEGNGRLRRPGLRHDRVGNRAAGDRRVEGRAAHGLDRYRGLEHFLRARRLVEAGVGCVTLAYGGWDTHGANFKTLKKQLPELDRGIANLIQDLHDRGMDQDVVTVVWGEFGRTPKINNTDGGRDHWAPVMSAMVAGGGMRMGQAIGTSSASRRISEGSAVQGHARPLVDLQGDGNRRLDDLPERQRTADVRSRRTRLGERTRRLKSRFIKFDQTLRDRQAPRSPVLFA